MSREMKYSGIPWIGEIPKGWSTIPFKAVVTNVTTGLNPRDNFELSKDAELYYVTIRNFKDGKLYLDENCDRIDRRAWEIIQNRSDLRKGDILFASISKDAQCYILDNYPHTWNINESVFALRGNYSIIYDKYLYYSLINPEYYNDLRLDATGTTFQSIKQKKLKDSTLVLPIYEEQQKIASFLDRKCAEIDEMIALQEKIVEELKAYKQSVITEAVTKGLNPDIPMKDSGIEWIGEIPEHWKVKPIKWDFDIIAGATPKTDKSELWDGDIPWITPADYKTEDRYIKQGRRCITEEGMASCATTLLPKGSVIFSKRAPIGLVVVNSQPLCTNQGCLGCIPRSANSSYFYYAMSAFTEQYELYGSGTTFKEISATNFADFRLPCPSIEEQESIALCLDKRCTEIENLISIKLSKIDSLKEYKKSIIYEYVTGKKEVI